MTILGLYYDGGFHDLSEHVGKNRTTSYASGEGRQGVVPYLPLNELRRSAPSPTKEQN